MALTAMTATMSLAQEDCLNGVDDDGDGMVDLNDPDCTCFTTAIDSLIGDFEDMICCPEAFTGGLGNGIECLQDWSQATIATSDYFHECGFVGGAGVPLMPLPLPSGNGAVGVIAQPGWSEYVGTCMPMSILAGETYSVSMYAGFSGIGSFPSNSPYDFGIYGTPSCDDYPANTTGCLADLSNWFELGTVTATGNEGEWTQVLFTITAPVNINAIAIGPACSEINNGPQYHFLDNVHINGLFGDESVDVSPITQTGDCVSGVELSIADVPGATYQWFLDGVAISGANSNPLVVTAGEDGTYTVLVDNGSGCGTAEVEVLIPTNVLDVGAEVTDVACAGEATGLIDLDLPDENPPITIQWGTGQNTEVIGNLLPGTYSVTITDDNGCSGVNTFFVVEPAEPLMVQMTDVVQPVGAGAQGSAEVVSNGGTPPYTYLWDNGETTAEATMLEPGEHMVTITDANGCEEVLTVTIHPPLVFSVEVINPECFGDCDGSIELVVSGGLPGYDFDWSNSDQSPLNVDLCADMYTVTITDVAGTQIIETVEVTSPDEIVIVGDFTETVCEGQDAYIETDVTGGTPDYSYVWTNGETTPDIYNLILPEYSVTVTDANGCTAVDTYFLTILDSLAMTADITQESCGGGANGAIDIDLDNGTPPYTFMWSNGFSGEDPDGLASGTYTVTVEDAQGCAGVQSFVVTQGGDLDIIISTTDASCDGFPDGSADILVEGGVPPYDFTWSNSSTTSSIVNVPPGDYTVTISDDGGCTTINSVTIGAGPGVEINLNVTDVSCAGGSDGILFCQVLFGNGPFSYDWSNGQQGESISGLSPGDHEVTVTDANGCTATAAGQITEPEELELAASIVSASCNGDADGSIDIAINGGTGPYTAEWDNSFTGEQLIDLPAGDYHVTVTDAAGCTVDSVLTVPASDSVVVEVEVTPASCNGAADGAINCTVTFGEPPFDFIWNYGNTQEDLINVPAGVCYVTVTDSRGCSAELEVEVFGAGTLEIEGLASGISCNDSTDGAIDLSITGGTAPISYSWSTGDSTEDVTGLGFGTYSVTVTDSEGCEISETYEIPNILPIIITGTPSNVSCFGESDGSIEVSVLGGTGPYSFLWSEGSTTEDIGGLGPDVYDVIVTDANGCSFGSAFLVAEPDSLGVELLSVAHPATPSGFGSATIGVIGGAAPYDIRWSNGESGAMASQLGIGSVSVTVTDANGCTALLTIEIQLISLLVSVEEIQNRCFGECEGELHLTVENGVPPYSVTWSTGDAGLSIAGLCSGTYAAVVTDASGTTLDLTGLIITEPPELMITSELQGVSCIDSDDGAIAVEISGGTMPYDLVWSDGPTDPDRDGLAPGIYALTITDVNDCERVEQFEIDDIIAAQLTAIPSDIDCENPTGSITIEGDNPSGYPILVNGQYVTGNTLPGLGSGDYIVEYEVNPDCRIEVGNVRIRIISDFHVDITPADVSVTEGDQIEFQAVINGYISNYVVEWILVDEYTCVAEDQYGNCLSILVTATTDQTLGMLVYDTTGCEDYAESMINVDERRDVFVPNVFTPNGDGTNDIFMPFLPDPETLVSSFRIFDRWGALVYEESGQTASSLQGWSGKVRDQEAGAGVFVYTMEIRFADGISEVLKGDVTLIR